MSENSSVGGQKLIGIREVNEKVVYHIFFIYIIVVVVFIIFILFLFFRTEVPYWLTQ